MELPHMLGLRQRFDASEITDIAGKIREEFSGFFKNRQVTKGRSVAVALSSRGIANYSLIVKAAVQCLKQADFEPFLVPAMGSHGAATAEGQQRVLEDYGITEKFIGAPIRSSLEVQQIGETLDHIPILVDKLAWKADYIVPINRIKSHTEFDHGFESGLLKMLTIGLGKERGARLYHKAFMVYGYPRVIQSVARFMIQSGKVLCGLGIVENGYARTAGLAVLSPDEMEQREKSLLKEAKRLAPKLPFDEADILVIDEMGKDISGSGVDTKVVGRILMPLISQEPERPKIKRIVICDLTEKTRGNADGVGIADYVSRRLVDKIDFHALYVNAAAGAEPEHAKIPVTLENDREALKAALDSVGLIALDQLKLMRIRNTLQLENVLVSAAYSREIEERDDLEITIPAHPLIFKSDGNLAPLDAQKT